MIFALAEVLRLKKFRQTDNMGSALGGIGDPAESFVEILPWIRAAGHLDQGHAKFFWGQRSDLRDQYSIRRGRVVALNLLRAREQSFYFTAEIAEKIRGGR